MTAEAIYQCSEEWLKLSEDNLLKVWDNPADDVFNELLSE
jgi:hypothetical protein